MIPDTNTTPEILTHKFIPIGDSLTIGHGVPKGQSWPDQLSRQLKDQGFDFTLVANPAHSGYTSQLALDQEIPVLEKAEVNFATVLIGANDMARGVDVAIFKRNFVQLLDRIQKHLPNEKQVLLFNLPDFAATPAAQKYRGHLHMEPYLKEFNDFIEAQGSERKLPLVDLYSVTRQLGPDPGLYIWDGLHPSARGYTKWEEFIRPIVKDLLKEAGQK